MVEDLMDFEAERRAKAEKVRADYEENRKLLINEARKMLSELGFDEERIESILEGGDSTG
jgi:hypothetical protein